MIFLDDDATPTTPTTATSAATPTTDGSDATTPTVSVAPTRTAETTTSARDASKRMSTRNSPVVAKSTKHSIGEAVPSRSREGSLTDEDGFLSKPLQRLSSFRASLRERDERTESLRSRFSFGHQPALSSLTKIEMDGWLEKQSGILKQWNRRYFVCANECLYYFISSNPSEIARETYHLCDFILLGLPGVKNGCGFQLVSQGLEIYLCADDPQSHSDWVEVLARYSPPVSKPADATSGRAARRISAIEPKWRWQSAQAVLTERPEDENMTILNRLQAFKDEKVKEFKEAKEQKLKELTSNPVKRALELALQSPDHFGYLYKQGDVVKSWKKRWFVLKDFTCYYFESPEDTSPKGSIKLFTDTVVQEWTYEVDGESVQGFAVVPPTGRAFYLRAIEGDEAAVAGWLRVLNKACEECDVEEAPRRPILGKGVPFFLADNGHASYRPHRHMTRIELFEEVCSIAIRPTNLPGRNFGSVTLSIFEGRNLPAGAFSGLYCNVTFGKATLRTPMSNTKPAVWNDTLVFQVVDPVGTIVIQACQEGVLGTELLGDIMIDLTSLEDGDLHEGWFALYAAKEKRSKDHPVNCGQLRLALQYSYNPVTYYASHFLPILRSDDGVVPELNIKTFKNNFNRIEVYVDMLIELYEYSQAIFDWELPRQSAIALCIFIWCCLNVEYLPVVVPFTAALTLFLRGAPTNNTSPPTTTVVTAPSASGASRRGSLAASSAQSPTSPPLSPRVSSPEIAGSSGVVSPTVLSPSLPAKPVANAPPSMSLKESEEKKGGEEKEKTSKSVLDVFDTLKTALRKIQNYVGEMLDKIERIRNLLSYAVPWKTHIVIVALFVFSLVACFVPFRYMILAIGLDRFTEKFRKTGKYKVWNFVFRVPTMHDVARKEKRTRVANCKRLSSREERTIVPARSPAGRPVLQDRLTIQ